MCPCMTSGQRSRNWSSIRHCGILGDGNCDAIGAAAIAGLHLQLVARATKKSLLAQLSCRVPTLEIQRSLAKKHDLELLIDHSDLEVTKAKGE